MKITKNIDVTLEESDIVGILTREFEASYPDYDVKGVDVILKGQTIKIDQAVVVELHLEAKRAKEEEDGESGARIQT